MLTPEQIDELDRALRLYHRGVYTPDEFSARLGHVARPDNVPEVLQRVPFEFASAVRSAAAAFQPVQAVGYWRSLPKFHDAANDRFPNPALLVSPEWREGERSQIISYLKSGWTYAQSRGMSYCRLECGIAYEQMGSRCLSDGEWVWPEGLAHYVEAHQVRLPGEFIEGMIRHAWRVPDDQNRPTYDSQGNPDYAFWVAWGQGAMERMQR